MSIKLKLNNCLFLYISCFVFLSCNTTRPAYLFTSFHEPADSGLRLLYSFDGFHWTDCNKVFLKPLVGGPRIMRDPSIILGPDGIFHVVWTTEWKNGNGFGYASSKDLIHWSEEEYIPIMQHEPDVVNVWAPELFYDDSSRQFIISFASCIPNRFPKNQEDEQNNHRIYYSTTKDFKTFSTPVLYSDPGFSVIDAIVVKKEQGKFVMVVKDNTRSERDIKVAFSNTPYGHFNNLSSSFSDHFTEGPAVVKVKNEWLIYYDAYLKKVYEAVTTKDFKTFTNIDNRIIIPVGHKHGTIITIKRSFLKKLLHQIN